MLPCLCFFKGQASLVSLISPLGKRTVQEKRDKSNTTDRVQNFQVEHDTFTINLNYYRLSSSVGRHLQQILKIKQQHATLPLLY